MNKIVYSTAVALVCTTLHSMHVRSLRVVGTHIPATVVQRKFSTHRTARPLTRRSFNAEMRHIETSLSQTRLQHAESQKDAQKYFPFAVACGTPGLMISFAPDPHVAVIGMGLSALAIIAGAHVVTSATDAKEAQRHIEYLEHAKKHLLEKQPIISMISIPQKTE